MDKIVKRQKMKKDPSRGGYCRVAHTSSDRKLAESPYGTRLVSKRFAFGQPKVYSKEMLRLMNSFSSLPLSMLLANKARSVT